MSLIINYINSLHNSHSYKIAKHNNKFKHKIDF